ncbi:hypothetical protein D3C78_726170 [compost metagenome]
MFWFEQRFFLGGGQHANPQWFGQEQFATRLRGAVALDAFRRDDAGDGQTKNRLRGVDGMATRQRDPRLLTGKAPALNHFASNFRRKGVNRPAQDGDRHDRFTAHRKNIADRIGGRDAPKIKRVIDDRHKEIGRADNAGAVA